MKLITWNVNGIRARATQLEELVEREAPDVVCLQEIKALPSQVPEFPLHSRLGSDYRMHWHGHGGYSGVALLVKRSAAPSLDATSPAFDFETRITSAVVDGVRIAATYVPNGGKDYDAKLQFMVALEGWVAETAGPDRPLLICGDLNVAREERDPASMLRLYRRLLAVRRESPALRAGAFRLLDAPGDVLAWERSQGDDRRVCAVNFVGVGP